MDQLLQLNYEPIVTKEGVIVGFAREGEYGYTESIHFEMNEPINFYKIKSQGWELTDMPLDVDEILACEEYARELGLPGYERK